MEFNLKMLGFIAAVLMIHTICYVQSKCDFPCDWVGKKFILYMRHNLERLEVTFDGKDPSKAVFIRSDGGVFVSAYGYTPTPLPVTCDVIVGSNIVVSWSAKNSTVYSCITFRMISPDVFTMVQRFGLRSRYGIDINAFDTNKLCANGGFFHVGRANGAKDPVDYANCNTTATCMAIDRCNEFYEVEN